MKILVGITYFWEGNENWWKMKNYLAAFIISRIFYVWFDLFIKLSCLGYWGIWTFRKKQAINCCCFLTVPHVSRTLVPQPGMNLCPLSMDAQSFNHWISRKVPPFKNNNNFKFFEARWRKIFKYWNKKTKSFFLTLYSPARGI